MAEVSHTKRSSRIIALIGALVFLVTSSALAFFVIWDAVHQTDTSTQSTADTKTTVGKKLSNFTPVDKIDSLKKEDTKVGDGQEVKATDTVTVLYTGALAKTGEIFESNVDSGKPATFGLDGVIKGWTEGIPGMKVGGTRRLLIPADMAYGAAGSGSKIPPNSDLVFDVTVLAIGGN